MLSLLNPRTWLILGLAACLAFSHGFAYRSGRAAVRADFDAYKITQAEELAKAQAAARTKEQDLSNANRKVTNDYNAEKKRASAAAAVAADRLRDLETALADSDASTGSGTDDPRGTIAGECAAALRAMDKYAQVLATQARGLQDYAGSVCVSK